MNKRFIRRRAEQSQKGKLDEEYFLQNLHRVGGQVICSVCSFSYADHPNETRILDSDGRPWAKCLCDGTWGKI